MSLDRKRNGKIISTGGNHGNKNGSIKNKKKNNNTVIVKNIIFPYHMVIINTSIYICCFNNPKEKLTLCPANLIITLLGAPKG